MDHVFFRKLAAGLQNTVSACMACMACLPKIYVGHAPKEAPEGSWILFPCRPDILRCGLAAILEIKTALKTGDSTSAVKLRRLWDRQQRLHTLEDLIGTDVDGEKFLDALEKTTMMRDDASFCSAARDQGQQEILRRVASSLRATIEREEERWDNIPQETRNAALVRIKDILWRIEREFFENLRKIRELVQKDLSTLPAGTIARLRHLNGTLDILDRLEIRGRDSAGLAVEITLPRAGYAGFIQRLRERGREGEFDRRKQLKDLVSGSIRHRSGDDEVLTFVFKVASEIGKLGENVQRLRELLREDRVWHAAMEDLPARVRYLSHTRWASNGIINIFNCHPLDNEVVCNPGECNPGEEIVHRITPFAAPHPLYASVGHIFVTLNGDIDNYEELKRAHEQRGTSISRHITTDAKIIALEIEARVRQGVSLEQAFFGAVNSFQGSHAIAMQSDMEPQRTFLALKGSGQAIYIGVAPDRYVVASEVYGLVADTDTYLSMDGEHPRPGHPECQGQIFIVGEEGGGLDGIRAYYYDGAEVPLSPAQLRKAEITTRDIDRQDFEHYFLKEIYQSPASVEKTTQGKIADGDGGYGLRLDDTVLPKNIRDSLSRGKIEKIYCIGQGTASVAAGAIAYRMAHALRHIHVYGLKASELSGFYLRPDMQDTLILAVTQSGTTTDTNQAVDMAKKRGAAALAIVNRRNSHITAMVDGVFYTSDGRDIEMSVASTKAFYTQVVAGEITTLALAQVCACVDPGEISVRLKALKELPQLLREVLGQESDIAALAAKWAPKYQHWAVVGSGPNRIAAEEIRIKLSELCYKSIACDCVEDKKHIDLSSEPLVLVCAAGMPPNVMGDIVKDVAIFKAHNSAPIVIVHKGESRFAPYARGTIEVPPADSLTSLIMNTMAGHLFGYHAARSIHDQSRFFANLRAALVGGLAENSWGGLLGSPEFQHVLSHFSREFQHRRRAGDFTAALSLKTGVELSILLLHAMGQIPSREFTSGFGQAASPENIGNALLNSLNCAVDELSRPIDAIKHQAKTVTVGTSRTDGHYTGTIFQSLEAAGISPDMITHDIRIRLLQLQPAIAEITGYSCYEIDGLDATGRPVATTTLRLVTCGGIARDIPSRAKHEPVPLVGTKRAVVQQGKVFLGLGLRDQRPILILPVVLPRMRLLLFHIAFARQMPLSDVRALLNTGLKFEDIQNIVTEANIVWKDEYLDLLSPQFLAVHDAREIALAILKKIGAVP